MKIKTLDDFSAEHNPSADVVFLRQRISELEAKQLREKKLTGEAMEIVHSLKDAIKKASPVKMHYTKQPKSSSPCTHVLQLTDWHYGAVTDKEEVDGWGEFSPEIAERRVRKLGQAIIGMTEAQRHSYNIPALHILGTGDYVSGDIHQELQVNNAFPAPVQAVRCGYLMGELIEMLAPYFKTVTADIVTLDNHGRMTVKPQSTQGGLNNWGYVVAEIAAQYVKALSNVKVNIHAKPSALVAIGPEKYLCFHGHQVKAWAGIPYYGLDRRAAMEAVKRMGFPTQEFTKMVSGHLHTSFNGDLWRLGGCFPAGMEVTMSDGTRKPIEQVIVGDKVLSAGGSINMVSNLFHRKVCGHITELRVGGRYNDISCTDDHKIWGFKRNRIQTLYHKTFHRSDLEIGFDRSVIVPQWIPAGMLGDGDYVHLPYPKFQGVDWDLDFCRFVGLYLAEGSASGADGKLHYIDFTFNENEEEYAEFVRAQCVKRWGRATKFLRVRNNGKKISKTWNVSCHSSEAAREMVRLCGKGSKNKILSNDLMGLSRRCHSQILGGWVQGDGHISSGQIEKDGRAISSTTISKHMADQMFVLSLRAGAIPSLLRQTKGGRKRNDAYTLRWGAESAALVAGLTNEKFNGKGKINRSGAMWIGDDAFAPLKLVGSRRFTGDVFNITVEHDHSYSVNGIGVANSLSGTDAFDHNCGRNSKPNQTSWLVHSTHGEFAWTRWWL